MQRKHYAGAAGTGEGNGFIPRLSEYGGIHENDSEIAQDIQTLAHGVTIDWARIYPEIDKVYGMIGGNPDLALKRLDEIQYYIAIAEAKGVGYTHDGKKAEPIKSESESELAQEHIDARESKGSTLQAHTRDKPSRDKPIDWDW